ncbi:MAG: hypothetical protein RIF32_02055 [Leptospirales bacterium]
MLRITGLFLILFSVLLTMAWPRSYDESPAVPFVWRYDIREGTESTRPAALSDLTPFNLVHATRAPVAAMGEAAGTATPGSSFLVGPASPTVTLEKGERVFAPFHGNGYFRYAKIGRELSFLARNGEELWRKPYKAYPVTDPSGDLVLLLTGDNNRIDIIDPSGNPFGVRSVSGNFMTDLDFAARRAAAALVFSTGALTVLNQEARTILSYNHESPDQPLFVKSCAIGPDAEVVAIHMLAGDQDRIIVLGIDGGDTENPEDYTVLRSIDLNATYPHLLHFAVNRHGLLLAAPDRTQFYALASGADRRIDGSKIGAGETPQAPAEGRGVDGAGTGAGEAAAPVYRPVFADRDYFVFGQGDVAVLLDRKGLGLTRFVVGGSGPFRVLPGPVENQFALHSPERIEIYEFAAAASE